MWFVTFVLQLSPLCRSAIAVDPQVIDGIAAGVLESLGYSHAPARAAMRLQLFDQPHERERDLVQRLASDCRTAVAGYMAGLRDEECWIPDDVVRRAHAVLDRHRATTVRACRP